MAHGTEDKTTWFEASRKWFDECTGAVADREFKAYEGWYHQLHADGPDSEQFFRDVGDWILARCDGDEGRQPSVGTKPGSAPETEPETKPEAKPEVTPEAKL
jgi:hypothetical protein